jgi:hypothetical protein
VPSEAGGGADGRAELEIFTNPCISATLQMASQDPLYFSPLTTPPPAPLHPAAGRGSVCLPISMEDNSATVKRCY